MFKQLKRSVLELWRKKTILDKLYKPKREQNHKLEDDNGSINSAKDIVDALNLTVDSSIES